MHFLGISLGFMLSYCMIWTNSAVLDALSDSVVAGVPIPFASKRLTRAVPLLECTGTESPQCAKDCKTLLFCNGENLLAGITCPPTTPDCDTDKNTCVVKRPDTQCPEAKRPFDPECPSKAENFYPDPKNCRKYNYCKDKRIVQSYECPMFYVYDMESGGCKRTTPCGVINCIGANVAIHPTYRHLYAFCSNNAIIEGSYSQCAQKSQEFDWNTFSCMSKCKKEGNMPHETNCKKYYRCLATGAWWVLEKTEEICPPTLTFNRETLVCDKSVLVCPIPAAPAKKNTAMEPDKNVP